METTTVPLTSLRRGALPVHRPDGEGSVQVSLDPSLKIGTAKVKTTVLHSGDELQIGKFRMVFLVAAAPT